MILTEGIYDHCYDCRYGARKTINVITLTLSTADNENVEKRWRGDVGADMTATTVAQNVKIDCVMNNAMLNSVVLLSKTE